VDFLVPPFESQLRILCRRHEIVMLHCFDDAERGETLEGVYRVWDPESGEYFLLDANSKHTKNLLSKHHNLLKEQLEDLGRKCRSDYLCLSVQDDYLQKLVHFFRRRGPSRL